jgi:hypothetical protein
MGIGAPGHQVHQHQEEEHEMITRWYKRSGIRVSTKRVQKSKDGYALGKRTGSLGGLKCSIQPAVADSVDRMTLKEFASWSGQYTWRDKL